MGQVAAPQVRIADRFDRLEARVEKAITAEKAGLMVEVLEHEMAMEIHLGEIGRLANKYEVTIDLHAIMHTILSNRDAKLEAGE